jgi:hypothetical protein
MTQSNMMKKLALGAAVAALLVSHQATAADSAVINFTAELKPGGYSGVGAVDPFKTGSVVNNLVNGVGIGSPFGPTNEWLKIDAQIVISEFTGDGTYTIGGPGGTAGGIYLVSPLLNRLETVSLRTEGPLQPASLALGAGRADGQPTVQRDDIYLPDFTPNGVATVTIAGDSVSIDYDLDFSTLPPENGRFLREGEAFPGDPTNSPPIPPGFAPTGLSAALDDAGARFAALGISGSLTAAVSTEGKGPNATTPFGGYTALDEVYNVGAIGGVLGNTIVPTSLALLNIEIDANNISSDGRSATNPETVLLPKDGALAPFFAATGHLVFFALVGAGTFDVSATVGPLPAAAFLMAPAAGMLVGFRRRHEAAAVC